MNLSIPYYALVRICSISTHNSIPLYRTFRWLVVGYDDFMGRLESHWYSLLAILIQIEGIYNRRILCWQWFELSHYLVGRHAHTWVTLKTTHITSESSFMFTGHCMGCRHWVMISFRMKGHLYIWFLTWRCEGARRLDVSHVIFIRNFNLQGFFFLISLIFFSFLRTKFSLKICILFWVTLS